MAVITRTTEVEAPAEAVWAILEDVRRLPDVSASTEAVLDAPERLRAIGDRFRQVVRLLGRTSQSDW